MEIRSHQNGYVYGQLKGLYELRRLWQAGFQFQGHETTTDTTGESWNRLWRRVPVGPQLRIAAQGRLDNCEMSLSTGDRYR